MSQHVWQNDAPRVVGHFGFGSLQIVHLSVVGFFDLPVSWSTSIPIPPNKINTPLFAAKLLRTLPAPPNATLALLWLLWIRTKSLSLITFHGHVVFPLYSVAFRSAYTSLGLAI